ncbi:MAG: 4Fe-4S binding protein [Oscillospiraceae bacterium]|nr:4Fe-4S binding protein [Oscillospiraceae bacterium]
MSNEEYGNRVVQYPPQYSVCTGCKSCQLLCALRQDGVTGPQHGGIQVMHGELDHMYHTVLACLHCADRPCYEACPKKDKAMCKDGETNTVFVNREECTGCGACFKACKAVPSRILIDKKNRKAKKCDLCRDRAEGPLCIQYCPARVLGLSGDPLPYEADGKGGCITK